ncbi:unnamed protein product, partial [Pocillopora meandrina]
EIPNKREVKSRKNTPEEKRKQNREWRKRKRQQKNASNLALLANTEVLLRINDGPNVAETSLVDKKSFSPNLDTEQVGNESGLIMLKANSKEEMVSNAKRPRLTTLLDVHCSRSATMLRMALGDDARRKPTQHSRSFLAQTTFQRIIASTLSYVHSWGYLHNDIKANNVVLERKSDPAKYDPILIDFGKSTKLGLPSSKRSSSFSSRKIYLAPEVQKERRYSISSDIYSLGRMLKAVSCLIGFYEKVRVLVKKATDQNPGDRPTVEEFLQQISTIIP